MRQLPNRQPWHPAHDPYQLELCKPVNHSIQLEIGDVLVLDQGMWNHLAIVIGENTVLQNTPKRGEHSATIEEFSEGKTFRVIKTQVPTGLVMLRAASILRNPKGYNLFLRNCEDTVNEVLTGKAVSPQVQGSVVLAFLTVGIFILANKSR